MHDFTAPAFAGPLSAECGSGDSRKNIASHAFQVANCGEACQLPIRRKQPRDAVETRNITHVLLERERFGVARCTPAALARAQVYDLLARRLIVFHCVADDPCLAGLIAKMENSAGRYGP